MLSAIFASVTDTTVPAGDFVPGTPNEGFGSTVADVISTVADNLGNNVYQTGLSLVVATAAIVAMLNVGVHRMVLVPVGIGASGPAGWGGTRSPARTTRCSRATSAPPSSGTSPSRASPAS